jgi:hypothetical protein
MLTIDQQAYLFRPADSKEWHLAQRRAARKTKRPPSQVKRGRKRKPRAPRARFHPASYAHAVKYAARECRIGTRTSSGTHWRRRSADATAWRPPRSPPATATPTRKVAREMG